MEPLTKIWVVCGIWSFFCAAYAGAPHGVGTRQAKAAIAAILFAAAGSIAFLAA
jgi:hypothetical protein